MIAFKDNIVNNFTVINFAMEYMDNYLIQRIKIKLKA